MASEPFVHVVDDDDAIRDSIGFLLSSSGLQWRSYSSARALLNRVGELEDGCIVTDVRMPEMTGLELVRELKHLGAPHPIVVLTGHADVALAVEAMKAGVDDFLEKPFQPEALLASITGAIAAGEGRAGRVRERASIQERIAQLTGRERDVLAALVRGLSNKEAGLELGISPRTVEIYRANLMTKMNAATLSELVRQALLADMI